MKVIIAGSRDVEDEYQYVERAVQSSEFEIDTIVSGNARGIDRAGEQLARDWAIDLVIFPANWNRYKNAAGVIRNTHMAEYADALIAIWDGKSKGTKHMIEHMQKLNKPVEINFYKKETV